MAPLVRNERSHRLPVICNIGLAPKGVGDLLQNGIGDRIGIKHQQTFESEHQTSWVKPAVLYSAIGKFCM